MTNQLINKAKDHGYQGDSNTEAICWMNAIEKGLDMSESARYERAKQMGFDINNIYHHGTSNQFDRFDNSKIGQNYTYSEDAGFFFTKKLSTAQNYARLHSLEQSEGRVLSVFLKFQSPYVTTTNSEYYSPADRFDLSCGDILHDVRLYKNDAILIQGTKNDDLCIVFDPSQILSIHAAFDPETESYKKKIDLNETLESFFLDFNLEKNEGIKELSEIAYSFGIQEKNNIKIETIKKEFNDIIEYFEYSNEKIIKNEVNRAINKAYNNELLDHKQNKKEKLKTVIKNKF